jgi:hypothetical protein
MINLLQLVTDFHFVSIKRKLFFGLVPFVILGLVFTLYSPIITHPKKIIGGLLLLSASIRFFKPILQITQKLLQKSLSISIPLVGFIHGLTNMGGGFLTVLISSLFHEKTLIRSHIAFGYFLMATSQLIVLGFIRPDSISWESGMSAIFSGLIYLVIANNSYQAALTAFIFFFGILMFF